MRLSIVVTCFNEEAPPCRTGAVAADASNKVSWRVRATPVIEAQWTVMAADAAREGLRAQAAK